MCDRPSMFLGIFHFHFSFAEIPMQRCEKIRKLLRYPWTRSKSQQKSTESNHPIIPNRPVPESHPQLEDAFSCIFRDCQWMTCNWDLSLLARSFKILEKHVRKPSNAYFICKMKSNFRLQIHFLSQLWFSEHGWKT